MDILEYLARLGYVGKASPTPESLIALQKAHLLSVPFENLDIHARKRIVLDPDRLFHKIVLMKRGGFCYELNGLFHVLLQKLGFHVALAMGRVYDRTRSAYGPEFDHMLILAKVDGHTWLVDVGFGDFAMHPLKLTLNEPVTDLNGQFVIERHTDEYFKVSRYSPEETRYLPEYLFSTTRRSLSDFTEMCLYHQTSPESHFTRRKLCSIATATGRVTLTDTKLVVTENGMRTVCEITDELEFDRALAQYFNIVL